MDVHVLISELFRNYAIILGGAVGLAIAIWRGSSLQTQALAAQHQAQVANRGHATEIFNKAVTQLKDQDEEVRLGAIYTLVQLQRDYLEFKGPILNVLSSFVRRRTSESPANPHDQDIHEILRFIREFLDLAQNRSKIGLYFKLDLSGSKIPSINFKNTNISQANFSKSYISFSVFSGIDGGNCQFDECILNESNFTNADLTGANFYKASLEKTSFQGAKLNGANFLHAKLRGVDFRNVDLQGAEGIDAHDFTSIIYDETTEISEDLSASITQYIEGILNTCSDDEVKLIMLGNLFKQIK